MFTGLIEAVCVVKSLSRTADSMQISIELGQIATGCKIGDSIAVNGVCLTIERRAGSVATFDVSSETLSKSALAGLQVASKVNIELAMSADARFGGHFVQGHIDGTATIKTIQRSDRFAEITFSAAPELMNSIVLKGSIAVDGISLTIARCDKNSFGVAVIPQTLEKTTLNSAKPGDVVNIETDIIVKAVKKYLQQILPQEQGLTAEKLIELGF
jgi:riboflavin synthase